MKKVLLFFVMVGILVGIIIGARTTKKNNEDVTEVSSGDVETSKLNIGRLSVALAEIDTLNPLRTKNSHVDDMMKLIYEPLISYNEENQLESSLATNWAKKDELTWLIKIRKDVYFHDEQKLTANDVKFTIMTIVENGIDSKYAENVSNISAVEVIDDETVSVSLTESDSYLPSKLTFPIIPEHYFKNDGIYDEEKANRPIGTGAYKYDSNKDNELVLTYNENWWKGAEARLRILDVKKYTTYNEAIKAFKSSEVDMVFTTMHNWKEKFGFIGVNSYIFESSKFNVIIPNTTKSSLSENSVRKAILSAINRENIVTNIFSGNAYIEDIPIASNSKYRTTSMEYDVEKAKQMLINAGWKQSNKSWTKNGKTLSYTLIVPKESNDKIAIAKQIKQDLSEIQIKVTVVEMAWNAYAEAIKNGNFDLALATLDIKNEYKIQDLVSTGNKYNYAKYSDTKMDEIISTMRISDGDVYENNMEKFKQYYKSELPYMGICFEANVILTNKSVKGEFNGTDYSPYRSIINFCK